MSITRRSFLAGIGSVSVGLLFRRRLDAVLDSLERDLADEPQTPAQEPSAVDIVIRPEVAFRPERLVVASEIAAAFVLENIRVDEISQFAASSCPVPAEMFTATALDAGILLATAHPGTEIRFRVRYVGQSPAGERFRAVLLGTSVDSARLTRVALPIDSMGPIVA